MNQRIKWVVAGLLGAIQSGMLWKFNTGHKALDEGYLGGANTKS